MAGRWSSEQVVAEHKDLQANAMAVDQSGQLALLAGRRALAVVNLSKPSEIVKKIPRNSKWEISAAQWNPHPVHAHLFVTASNQRADLWSWDGSSCSSEPQGSLKAHTRVISDMDWSPKEPTQIATCSVDTYTYLWDTRDIRKPSLALQAVAGASQVKWNKVNSNLLATTHDGDIRIWDPRRGTSPVQYIAAHLAKIHGLDWSPHSEYHLATSSQDSMVKFWDVTNPKQPEIKLPSPSPVWRARYTPFGHGLVSVVVPQLRRGENSLFLWSLMKDQLSQSAVHTFVGHTDVVLEFQWRKPDEESQDFQLVTWSKDQSLRLWMIDSHLQKLCGAVTADDDETSSHPESAVLEMVSTESVASSPPTFTLSSEAADSGKPEETPATDSPLVSDPVKIPKVSDHVDGKNEDLVATTLTGSGHNKDNGHSPGKPKNLLQEFRLVNLNIPNVKVSEMDAFRRTCTVSTVSGPHIVHLTMHFPTSYPDKEAPSFELGKATTLDKTVQNKLIKILCDTAKQHVSYNRSCIEPCLRQLVSSLEALTSEERKSPESDLTPYALSQPAAGHRPPNFLPIFNYSNIQDQGIPFPRTSGAKFCGVGILVCFSRRSEMHSNLRRASSSIDATPRSMSTLSAFSQASLTPTGPVMPPILNIFNMNSMASMARSPPTDNTVSLTNYYSYKERESRKSRQRSKPRLRDSMEINRHGNRDTTKAPTKVGHVAIYNVSCLLPVQRTLAENYVLDPKDVPAMCRKNASVAASVGREDLVQMWSLAALANDVKLTPSPDPDKGPPWACHPFGRKMLKSLLAYYSSIHDVQTLTMLCCTFGSKFDAKATALQQPPQQLVRSSSRVDETGSTSDFPLLISPLAHDVTFLSPQSSSSSTIPRMKRSNSCSDVFDESYRFVESKDQAEIEQEQHMRNMRMLDASSTIQYDNFKRVYADLLYRWGLLGNRALILKYVSTPSESHRGLEIRAKCPHCSRDARDVHCTSCNSYVLQCSICHSTVKGASTFCLLCGHGGHTSHLMSWFHSHNVCPTGCGCICTQQNAMHSSSSSDITACR